MVSVSSFEDRFREAFDTAKDLPQDYEDLIKRIEDYIWDKVQNKLREGTVYYLKDNIQDDICQEAASVAESMLRNALAGDNKTLRNLFGFSDWYMRHRYLGDHPTEYALLDHLIQRHPDLFVNEKIAQLETDNAALKKEINRIRTYYREKYEEEEY